MLERRGSRSRNRQQGVVLMVALIVLVAMTLAGISLMRSVDTTSLIAGNLAFQQSATNSADIGTETAVTWLTTNNSGTTLHSSIISQGYVARREDPSSGQSWDAFWSAALDPSGGPSRVWKLAQDPVTGNTVAYVIHRMCNLELDPTSPSVDCAQAQGTSTVGGSSKGSGAVQLLYNSSIFYRITTRVAGPRNTVSYVQTIVSL